MLVGIHALRLDLLKDGKGTAVDGLVLVIHDGSRAHGRVISQITCKAGNGGNDNDDPEFPARFARSDAGIDDGSSNDVVDGVLLVAGGGDEELILDVDKVLGVANDFAVGVLDAVFGQDAATPITAASNDLGVNGALLLERPRSVFEGRYGMMDVLSDRVLGTLDRHQILELAFSAGHG